MAYNEHLANREREKFVEFYASPMKLNINLLPGSQKNYTLI